MYVYALIRNATANQAIIQPNSHLCASFIAMTVKLWIEIQTNTFYNIYFNKNIYYIFFLPHIGRIIYMCM